MTDQKNFDREDVIARLDALLGRGWRRRLAEAMGMDHNLVSRMNGPTLRTCGVLVEWLETIPRAAWPARWAILPEPEKAEAEEGA